MQNYMFSNLFDIRFLTWEHKIKNKQLAKDFIFTFWYLYLNKRAEFFLV